MAKCFHFTFTAAYGDTNSWCRGLADTSPEAVESEAHSIHPSKKNDFTALQLENKKVNTGLQHIRNEFEEYKKDHLKEVSYYCDIIQELQKQINDLKRKLEIVVTENESLKNKMLHSRRVPEVTAPISNINSDEGENAAIRGSAHTKAYEPW